MSSLIVGVVTPAYNATTYLEATVASLQAQSYQHWEQVIVDDGSNDGTLDLARSLAAKDPRITVITQPNGGVSSARNAGIAAMSERVEHVMFLDSDDLLQPKAMEILLHATQNSPDCLGAYGLVSLMDAQGEPFDIGRVETYQRDRSEVDGSKLKSLPLDAPTTFATLAYRDTLLISGTLLKRSALPPNPVFKPGMAYCEDYMLWLRIARNGWFHFVNEPVIRYRVHSQNASRNDHNMYLSTVHARALVARDPETTPDQRLQLEVGYRMWEQQNARYKWQDASEKLRRRELVGAALSVRRAITSSLRARRSLSKIAIASSIVVGLVAVAPTLSRVAHSAI